jgi:hypothetical protein
MSTIPGTVDKISTDIQNVFEQMMKLILRKTLRPTLNPLKPNDKIIYNPYTKKYERQFVGASPDEHITNYNYQMTSDCLGWSGDYITSFKLTGKFIKNSFPTRHPGNINKNAKLTNVLLAYNSRALADSKADPINSFRTTMETLMGRTMLNTVSNNRGEFVYNTDVSYTDCWKQLNSIGQDIINQTDASIPANDSAKMSTSFLRIKLFTLDQDLFNFSLTNKPIYESYVNMVSTINYLPRELIPWIINLIATLTYQSWDELTPTQQSKYISELGEEFINRFNSNQLITILLQSNRPELILTSSYLYSLLKMLFVTFGYNDLENPPTTYNSEFTTLVRSSVVQSHQNKIKPNVNMIPPNFGILKNFPNEPCITTNCLQGSAPPFNECTLQFIKTFCELYPSITQFMGGCQCLPEHYTQLNCASIPPNYNDLVCIDDYLWRYLDYSYCAYTDIVSSKIVTNSLNTKIDDKVRYLKTV